MWKMVLPPSGPFYSAYKTCLKSNFVKFDFGQIFICGVKMTGGSPTHKAAGI